MKLGTIVIIVLIGWELLLIHDVLTLKDHVANLERCTCVVKP